MVLLQFIPYRAGNGAIRRARPCTAIALYSQRVEPDRTGRVRVNALYLMQIGKDLLIIGERAFTGNGSWKRTVF